MLSITARNINTDNRNCARCFSPGNMYEMETVKTHRGSEYNTLYFHPACFDKYEHAKLCIAKGIGGIEIDAAGNRINIQRVLENGNKFNADHDKNALVALLKTVDNPEQWVKNYLEGNK